MRQFTFSPGVLDGGLNNCDDELLIKNKQLSDCQNVIFDENQFIQKRPSAIVNTSNENPSKTGSSHLGKNAYVHKRKDGTSFQIVFTIKTVEDNDLGTVLYSQNGADWYEVYTGLNPLYQVQFKTFGDNLIITNGIDEPLYWNNPSDLAIKIGQVRVDLTQVELVTKGCIF